MEANELMIGDYVYLLKNKIDIKEFKVIDACPRRVTAINTDGDESYIQTDDCDVFYDMSAYQPIIITPEILEKNGFKKDEEGDEDTDFVGNEFVLILCKDRSYNCCFDGHRTISGNFTYIHELQQALRLCGINKEIVL